MNRTAADVGNEIPVPTDLISLLSRNQSFCVDLHGIQPQTHTNYFDVEALLMKYQRHLYDVIQGVSQSLSCSSFHTLVVEVCTKFRVTAFINSLDLSHCFLPHSLPFVLFVLCY